MAACAVFTPVPTVPPQTPRWRRSICLTLTSSEYADNVWNRLVLFSVYNCDDLLSQFCRKLEVQVSWDTFHLLGSNLLCCIISKLLHMHIISDVAMQWSRIIYVSIELPCSLQTIVQLDHVVASKPCTSLYTTLAIRTRLPSPI